jgi:eukaryotic-like serine/threonine-protein kinase
VELGAGLILDQRFRLVAPVSPRGSGGAWRAVDEVTGHDVAVKALPSSAAADAAAKASFQIASRTAAALSHPGVAQVYHCGHVISPAGPAVPYLVRDLVSGPTLAARLCQGAMTVGDALAIAAAIADILSATHHAGLVHGHLVPENVILSPAGVTVTDFGLWASSERPEQALFAVLAPHACYTAPEQLCGGPVTPATDMYSLGAVFTACLTGAGGPPRTAVTQANCVASSRKTSLSAPRCAAGGMNGGGPTARAGNGRGTVPTRGCVAGVPGAGASRFAELSAKVGADIASLWAACLAANPAVRPSAAHAAAMSRQLIIPVR